ncbi:hypothetical protein C6B38_06705 [Spiroplasma sp. ChiS]|nr:hypothetical protein [Spiroplasma sp. ChiS]PQP78380.1 hypothetical protein C6B38_06705 [Spiroplasma sp. ChiS]
MSETILEIIVLVISLFTGGTTGITATILSKKQQKIRDENKELKEKINDIKIEINNINTKLDVITIINNKLANNNKINIRQKNKDGNKNEKEKDWVFLRLAYWIVHGLTLGLPILFTEINKLMLKLKEKINNECILLDENKEDNINDIIKKDDEKEN